MPLRCPHLYGSELRLSMWKVSENSSCMHVSKSFSGTEIKEQAENRNKHKIKGQLSCFSISWFYKRDVNCSCLK